MIGSGGESGPRRQLLCVFICREDLQEGVARRNGVSGKVPHCILRTRSSMLPVPYTIMGEAKQSRGLSHLFIDKENRRELSGQSQPSES